uniref:Uncharacterized protein n=1 Tax=Helianthus annuus TaxID=4232 RepID=A0A251U1C4_HELAN
MYAWMLLENYKNKKKVLCSKKMKEVNMCVWVYVRSRERSQEELLLHNPSPSIPHKIEGVKG